jgi:hypothetical protein
MLKRFAVILVIITFNLLVFTLILTGTTYVTQATSFKGGSEGGEFAARRKLHQTRTGRSTVSDWVIERVDAPKIFEHMGDRSMELDNSGNPHIAYGKDHLYYAWFDGSSWQREKVDDSPGVGAYASIALDDSGMPHISYYDAVSGTLKYAYKNGASWDIQVVDRDKYVTLGEYTSLALDKDGNPHIGYSSDRYTNVGVKYAKWTGSSWDIETIDQNGLKGVSLALDSSDNAHLSYRGQSAELKYAHNKGSSWITMTVDSPSSLGDRTSLALDSNGDPHISYQGDFNLKYGHWTGDAWFTETITDIVSDISSIAIDNSDNPHIIYWDIGLQYTQKKGGGWDTERVEFNLDSDAFPSLALDNNNNPHVSYFHSNNLSEPGELRFAEKERVSWNIQIVDKAANVGEFTSLAIEENGNLHISYLDNLNLAGNLKYAFWNGTSWISETVDNYMSYQPTSLVLDKSGNPHIAYSSNISGYGPRYAYKKAGTWISETLDTSGWYVSLALDSHDHPHISYFHLFEQTLKYAHWTGSEWDIQTIEKIGNVGGETSIAIDNQDNPHISYHIFSQPVLKYTHLEAGKWISETVDTFGGRFSSIYLDEQQNPHISYQGDGTRLKYAYLTANGWISETVDSELSLGWYTSLGLDSEGNPHISYHNLDERELKYASKNGGLWMLEVVENVGEVGEFTSLAIGADGQVYISYYDLTNDDLKLASRGAPGTTEPSAFIFLPVILNNQ